jgi:uncharacterized protein (TIGR02453 family)
MPTKIAAPPFDGFPLEAHRFLADLTVNNDRAWFNEHKAVYERSIKAPAEAFAAAMQERLEAQFDRGFKAHLFRIYRDSRFSKDKTPYHAYLRVGFHPLGGGRDDWTGFFLSFEPQSITLGAGLFWLDGKNLDAFRAAIADDVTGGDIQALLDGYFARGMRLHAPSLKRAPAPYGPTHPRAELLKHKGFALFHDVTDFDAAATPAFLDTCLAAYAEMAPLNDWLEETLSRA